MSSRIRTHTDIHIPHMDTQLRTRKQGTHTHTHTCGLCPCFLGTAGDGEGHEFAARTAEEGSTQQQTHSTHIRQHTAHSTQHTKHTPHGPSYTYVVLCCCVTCAAVPCVLLAHRAQHNTHAAHNTAHTQVHPCTHKRMHIYPQMQ